MAVIRTSLEERLYVALKRIAAYQSPQRLLKFAEKDWGCSGEEALEMAYENIQSEARAAVKGVRYPKGPRP